MAGQDGGATAIIVGSIITAAGSAATATGSELAKALSRTKGANDLGVVLVNDTPWRLSMVAGTGTPIHGMVLEPPSPTIAGLLDGRQLGGGDTKQTDNIAQWEMQSKGNGSQVHYLFQIEGFPRWSYTNDGSTIYPTEPDYWSDSSVDKSLYLAFYTHNGVDGQTATGAAIIGDKELGNFWDGQEPKLKQIGDIIEGRRKVPVGQAQIAQWPHYQSGMIELGPIRIRSSGGEVISYFTIEVPDAFDTQVWEPVSDYLAASKSE